MKEKKYKELLAENYVLKEEIIELKEKLLIAQGEAQSNYRSWIAAREAAATLSTTLQESLPVLLPALAKVLVDIQKGLSAIDDKKEDLVPLNLIVRDFKYNTGQVPVVGDIVTNLDGTVKMFVKTLDKEKSVLTVASQDGVILTTSPSFLKLKYKA